MAQDCIKSTETRCHTVKQYLAVSYTPTSGSMGGAGGSRNYSHNIIKRNTCFSSLSILDFELMCN